MDWQRAVACVLGGTVVAVVGMFVPLIRWFAPALGGGLAGYAYDEGRREGAKVGGAVAVVAIAAFVAFGLTVFGVLALLGAAASDPDAFVGLAGFGGFVAFMWVVVAPVMTAVMAPAGGVLGGHLADERGAARGTSGGAGGAARTRRDRTERDRPEQ